jgi:hypothetical protein
MIIDPRIPKPVEPIIKKYVLLTEKRFVGLIDAYYIVGSIALNEFNENYSDIDFVAVLNRRAIPLELEHLLKIHQSIEKMQPQWKMSGSYIQANDLGKLGMRLASHPQFHDGILHPAAQDGINSVTWWELKNYGIPVFGPEPRNLPFTVDWDFLVSEMKENLNSYWRSWTRHPKRLIMLYSDWGIQWAVLGVLRQFYTFRENSITTKVRAGEYALGCLPQPWHRLVQEAIAIRQGKKPTFYRSRSGRIVEAVYFLNYIINICNTHSLS